MQNVYVSSLTSVSIVNSNVFSLFHYWNNNQPAAIVSCPAWPWIRVTPDLTFATLGVSAELELCADSSSREPPWTSWRNEVSTVHTLGGFFCAILNSFAWFVAASWQLPLLAIIRLQPESLAACNKRRQRASGKCGWFRRQEKVLGQRKKSPGIADRNRSSICLAWKSTVTTLRKLQPS